MWEHGVGHGVHACVCIAADVFGDVLTADDEAQQMEGTPSPQKPVGAPWAVLTAEGASLQQENRPVEQMLALAPLPELDAQVKCEEPLRAESSSAAAAAGQGPAGQPLVGVPYEAL